MGREPPICADDSLRARSCLARKPGDVCQLMFRVLGQEKELTLVVDLACGLNEILEVSASQEVTKVDKLAVPLVLYVDCAPAVLTSGYVATVQYQHMTRIVMIFK